MWLNRERIDQTEEVVEDITEVAEVADDIIQTEDINILYFWRKEAWKRASFFVYTRHEYNLKG